MSDRPQPSVLRELIGLAWPVVGLNVLAVLSLAVDTAMIGRTAQADAALTGLGFAVQTIFLLMVAMMGLAVGAVALVSRAHGARDALRARFVVEQSMVVALLLGLLTALLGNLLAPPFIGLLGGSGADREQALLYLRPLLLFSPFNYLSILFTAVLRGVGNTRLPFLVALASNLVNFVCNAVLIFGNLGFPALGMLGAALGTGISQVFSVLVVGSMLFTGRVPALHLHPRLPRPDLGFARDLFRIGAPAALDMVVLNAGMLSIIGMIGRIDPLAVAAHGMGLRVQALAFVPGMSIAQAIAALTGQAIGARDPARVKSVLRAGIGLCVVIMTVLGVAIAFNAHSLVRVFDLDPEGPLGQYTQTWMRILGYTMTPVGLFLGLTGYFQGSGQTRTPLIINTASTFLVLMPASWVLGFPLGLGVAGVWIGLPLSFVAKAALAAWVYRRSDPGTISTAS